ncbi:MAG: carbohydrate ABC transporter permease [Chloroflexi bacterium]|nr:carbohydrate ABC transporter permease [Chloroflexota bacterium]
MQRSFQEALHNSRFSSILQTLLRVLVAVLFLLPLVWMIIASLFPPGEPLPTALPLLPSRPTLANYGRIFQLLPIGQYTLNSMRVVLLAVPLTLLVSSWAGLGMARLPQAKQRQWVVMSLAMLMIPGIALWSTRFLIYRWLGWYDSVWALIAPAWMGTSPFFVLMFYRAFRRIPAGIYDAARLDGATVLQTWWMVVLPMVRTTAVAVALLTFVVYWGDFVSPLLYLRTGDQYTLPVALQTLQQLSRSDWALMLAAAVWTMIIPIVLFLLLQPIFNRSYNQNNY